MPLPALKVHSSAILTAALLLAPVSAPGQTREPPLLFMSRENPAMKQAFERARASLDPFLELAVSGQPELTNFAVKVGISEDGRTEYFWIDPFTYTDDQFTGKIVNTPQMVKNLRLGQAYEFTRAQIVDWMYIDRARRKMMGNFTLCALMTQEPPAKAAATLRKYNLDCE